MTHKLVLRMLFNLTYEGTTYSDVENYYQPYTKEDFNYWMDEYVENNAEEDYDDKTFIVLATRGIRDGLDYELLGRVWEEMSWEMFVYELFHGDEEDEDSKKYWENYHKVESRVMCDW